MVDYEDGQSKRLSQFKAETEASRQMGKHTLGTQSYTVIYIPRSCLTPIFEGEYHVIHQKIGVKWVLGIGIYNMYANMLIGSIDM